MKTNSGSWIGLHTDRGHRVLWHPARAHGDRRLCATAGQFARGRRDPCLTFEWVYSHDGGLRSVAGGAAVSVRELDTIYGLWVSTLQDDLREGAVATPVTEAAP